MSKAHMRAQRCAPQDDSASLPDLRAQWEALDADDWAEMERLHEQILVAPVRDMADMAALALLATDEDENEFGARLRAVAARLLRPKGRWAALLALQRERIAARHTVVRYRYTAPPCSIVNDKGRLKAPFSASFS